jgi:hypothetical protein
MSDSNKSAPAAADTTAAPAATATTTTPAEWTAYIAPFAVAIGRTPEAVTEAIKDLVGDAGPEAIGLLQSAEYTSYDDLKNAFAGVPAGRLKKAIADHLRTKEAAQPAQPNRPLIAPGANQPSAFGGMSLEVLPALPDDGTWLTMLRTGGQLKVDSTSVIAAVRAALANRVNLYNLPDLLVERMEAHAELIDEPCGEAFYRCRKLLTQRSYGDLLTAMGVPGTFISEKKKTALLTKLDQLLWPSLIGFQGQLRGWSDTWQQGAASSAMMISAITAMLSGGGLPPGAMQPPPSDGLRDAAEGVIATINKVFAGTGLPVAKALAFDAHTIREVLENPELPAQVGATTRDQMLKSLNVAVTADYVRLERSLTRYVLAIMELPNVTPGNQEIAYLGSLMMLGSQISWDKLQVSPRRPTR